jgi:hypothetical protein
MTALRHSDPIARTIAEDVQRLNDLGAYLKYTIGNPLAARAGRAAGWIAEAELGQVEGPQEKLFAPLARDGFGGNRRAISASVLLRYGWSSGFLIGAYLVSGRVYRNADLALRFSSNTVLAEIAIRSADAVIEPGELGNPEARAALAHELHSHAAPIVEAHHQWSGFSRKALWSMVVSSFGSQFTHISEKLGNPEHGLIEADHILTQLPEIEAARPDLYMVRAEGKRGVCQMRRLCCLWFKGGKKQFCASCPIIPDDDRLARNAKWIADRGLPDSSQQTPI